MEQENRASKKAISAAFPYKKKYKTVSNIKMAYVETGAGDPIVFLHGNPTSSYLWRNIIPYLQGQGRCIAPDLVGMGDSEKLPNSGPNSYTFEEQRKYLDELLSQLGVNQKITFVVHDWGSALAFDWAYRHPEAVKGIAYMEAIVAPYSMKDMPPQAQNIFTALRSPAGEDMVLKQNSFIEINLPGTVLRKLSSEEMENYRKPFLQPGESRRAMLSWARQLPLDGQPENIAKIVTTYGNWLSTSDIPKLYIEADPGTMPPSARAFCKTWKNQVTVTAKGRHYVQEDSPDEIGMALSTWLTKINKQQYNKTMNTNAELNKKIVRNLYENILKNRRFEDLSTVISEDYTGIQGEKGVPGFLVAVKSVIDGFPDIEWKIMDMIAEDDKVTLRWTWTATNSGPFRGIAASNKTVTDNAIVIYQLRNGKIINAWMQGDRLGVLIQIGAIPQNLVPGPPAKVKE